MIDHVSIGVRDLRRTRRFYDAALKLLGYRCLSDGEHSLGYGREGIALWISVVARPVPPDDASGLHFCFAAPTRKRWTHSTPQRSTPGDATTASRACAPNGAGSARGLTAGAEP